jgi:hypothetical protein
VFANDIFAMKGGTAINLFVHDMPRLSVDIDVVYTPWQMPREQALAAIAAEIEAIARRVAKRGMRARKMASKDLGETKLLIERDGNQVKVEVNAVFCIPSASDGQGISSIKPERWKPNWPEACSPGAPQYSPARRERYLCWLASCNSGTTGSRVN